MNGFQVMDLNLINRHLQIKIFQPLFHKHVYNLILETTKKQPILLFYIHKTHPNTKWPSLAALRLTKLFQINRINITTLLLLHLAHQRPHDSPIDLPFRLKLAQVSPQHA